jgi:hypothetical protein
MKVWRLLFFTSALAGGALVAVYRFDVPNFESERNVAIQSDWHAPEYQALKQFAQNGLMPASPFKRRKVSRVIQPLNSFARTGFLPRSRPVGYVAGPALPIPQANAYRPVVVARNPMPVALTTVQPRYVTKNLPTAVTLYGDLNYDPLFLSLDQLRRKQLKDQDSIQNITSQYTEVRSLSYTTPPLSAQHLPDPSSCP